METRRRIDTHNPQLAKSPLADFSIAVSKFPTAFDSLTRLAKQLTTPASIPFGMI
jgi:hypothetical protein